MPIASGSGTELRNAYRVELDDIALALAVDDRKARRDALTLAGDDRPGLVRIRRTVDVRRGDQLVDR